MSGRRQSIGKKHFKTILPLMSDLHGPNYDALWGGDAATIRGHLLRIQGTVLEMIKGVRMI